MSIGCRFVVLSAFVRVIAQFCFSNRISLDESSSALDTESEERLLRHLRVLLESEDNNLSAVLFMTHKRSVLKACDRVASLKDGIITL